MKVILSTAHSMYGTGTLLVFQAHLKTCNVIARYPLLLAGPFLLDV